MDIGKKFRRFRIKAGLSQKEAAELIGVKNYQLGNYETNRSEPSIAVLKKMSQVYGVSIDALVGNYRTLEEKGLDLKPIENDLYEPDEVLKTILEYIKRSESTRLNSSH